MRFHVQTKAGGQQGQAMAFTLLFAGATGLVCLLLYNSATLANTKTGLQNAADAGAYSAAVMLARDHNFSAYTNRAMVANQVAVAQLVSVKSYLQDAAATHKRMGGFLLALESKIPLSKPLWNIGKGVPIEGANSAYSGMAGGAVKSLDLLIKAFETGQELHHHATAANVMFVVDEVVKKNDPKARVTTGAFQIGTTVYQLGKWDTAYTKRHRANNASAQADRFADAVVSEDSTDGFVRNRISAPVASWLSTPNPIACLPGVPVATAFGFAHSGGTILSANKKRWLALDATMGAGFFSCTYVTPLGPVTTVYPLIDGFGGSGGAVAGAGGGYKDATGYKNNPFWTKFYGYALINPATIIPAGLRWAKGPGATLDRNGGLQDYYRDVADTGAPPANQSAALNGGKVPLTIEVEHVEADIRTSAKVLGNAPATVKLEDGLKGGTMRALSSAHAYFYRSNTDSSAFTRAGWRRADGKTEMANLFNPYWQAQLVERSEASRLMSIGAQ